MQVKHNKMFVIVFVTVKTEKLLSLLLQKLKKNFKMLICEATNKEFPPTKKRLK